jgi:hypothetical protein
MDHIEKRLPKTIIKIIKSFYIPNEILLAEGIEFYGSSKKEYESFINYTQFNGKYTFLPKWTYIHNCNSNWVRVICDTPVYFGFKPAMHSHFCNKIKNANLNSRSSRRSHGSFNFTSIICNPNTQTTITMDDIPINPEIYEFIPDIFDQKIVATIEKYIS